VPRDELLKYLRRAAEALDELYRDYGLQHLTLNPRALVLDRGTLRIADFGMAELIWMPAGVDAAKLNPRYAPPELFEGRLVPTSDQYSLALIYQELLTGLHGFRNLSPRQLSSPRQRGLPNLDLLPASDRGIIAAAIDPDPEKRYPTSTALIAELEHAGTRPPEGALVSTAVHKLPTPKAVPIIVRAPGLLPSGESHKHVQQLLGEAKAGVIVGELKGFRYRVIPETLMEHQFTAKSLQGTLPIKLEGFRRHWPARIILSSDNKVVYHICPPVTGLQRLLGRVPGLELQVKHTSRPGGLSTMGIAATLQPLPRGEKLLEEMGPKIFDTIRHLLQAVPDRRCEERFRLRKSLKVIPVIGNQETGEGIVARALDISRAGLGFYVPCRPKSSSVLLELGAGTDQPMVLAAKIVHSEECADGQYQIGVVFEDKLEEPARRDDGDRASNLDPVVP
jgi:hypothetical protein